MKLIVLFSATMLTAGFAQAEVYKCAGEIEGKYTYQQKPCNQDAPEASQIEIHPVNEAKIARAKEKSLQVLEAHEKKKQQNETPKKKISKDPIRNRPSPKPAIVDEWTNQH